MPSSDTEQAAQILRGHDKRISRLEGKEEPEGPANLIRLASNSGRLWDDVSISETSTTTTKWDSAEWDQSSSGGSVMNWS